MQSGRLLLLLLAIGFTEPALALRCGNKLVQRGDPMPKVLKYCGEPVATQTRSIVRRGIPRSRVFRDRDLRGFSDEELLINDRSYVEVLVDEWTYNFGPRKLMRIIRFENGLVADVTELGYGYRD
ncbi:MAG: DUF2845 domain-containing protein [Chromatiales bacterium]|nr:MAG: DUF2845 domain-containing protein [Chromatiales bacterium]